MDACQAPNTMKIQLYTAGLSVSCTIFLSMFGLIFRLYFGRLRLWWMERDTRREERQLHDILNAPAEDRSRFFAPLCSPCPEESTKEAPCDEVVPDAIPPGTVPLPTESLEGGEVGIVCSPTELVIPVPPDAMEGRGGEICSRAKGYMERLQERLYDLRMGLALRRARQRRSCMGRVQGYILGGIEGIALGGIIFCSIMLREETALVN